MIMNKNYHHFKQQFTLYKNYTYQLTYCNKFIDEFHTDFNVPEIYFNSVIIGKAKLYNHLFII